MRGNDVRLGFGDESAGEVLSLFFPQVDGDGLLVAGDDRPPEVVRFGLSRAVRVFPFSSGKVNTSRKSGSVK